MPLTLWANRRIDVRIYHKSAESGSGPAWICGHWNGSPIEIGMGLRSEVGSGEVRHHHPYREYFVVLEGAAELDVEGTQVALRPGMVVMVEPGERHMVMSVGEAGAHWVVIKEHSEPNTKYAS
jgi:mannose-6-phosphate isomerase-like protein (cupin superfamily)